MTCSRWGTQQICSLACPPCRWDSSRCFHIMPKVAAVTMLTPVCYPREWCQDISSPFMSEQLIHSHTSVFDVSTAVAVTLICSCVFDVLNGWRTIFCIAGMSAACSAHPWSYCQKPMTRTTLQLHGPVQMLSRATLIKRGQL